MGLVLYLKRIKADLFYDFAYGESRYTNKKNKEKDEDFQAWGTDLSIDFHLLTLPAPISLGIRTVYLFKKDEYVWQPLINIGFPTA